MCKIQCVRCNAKDAMFSVSCHASGSLEGGCPSSAEVIEDTEDSSGFYSLFSVPIDLQYMFERYLKFREGFKN